MDVVTHQAPCYKLDVEPRDRGPDERQNTPSVFIVFKQKLLAVASHRNVIQASLRFLARFSRHGHLLALMPKITPRSTQSGENLLAD